MSFRGAFFRTVRLGFEKVSKLNKIVNSGPEGENQCTPQKKCSDGMRVQTEKRIMDQQRYGSSYLESSLIFSKIGCRNIFSLFSDNVAKSGHGNFTADNNADHPGRRPAQGGQHNEGGRYQELVCHRIHYFSQIRYQAESSGKITVKVIRDSRGAKYDRCSPCRNPGGKQHQDHYDRNGCNPK